MPRLSAPLTDAEARHAAAGPDGKPRKLAAGKGLFLLVTPTAKLWRLKYRVAGKENAVSPGSYPEVGIAEARRLRDAERENLAAGRDPAAERRAARSEYVFPSARGASRCMSNAAMLAALRRMGYDKTEMTAHGFRALASSLLNAQNWEADVIERQLAHAERSKTRAAYHRHQYVPERRRMMQALADYLDGLAKGADVVPIGAARKA